MTNRNAEVVQAMQSLEIVAQGLANSFDELVELTDPAAHAEPLQMIGVLAPDSDHRNTFSFAAKINRVSIHLRLLQAAVDRVRRRAGRRLARNRKSAAPDPGPAVH